MSRKFQSFLLPVPAHDVRDRAARGAAAGVTTSEDPVKAPLHARAPNASMRSARAPRMPFQSSRDVSLSTLHANDSVAAITRPLALGVPPYLLNFTRADAIHVTLG